MPLDPSQQQAMDRMAQLKARQGAPTQTLNTGAARPPAFAGGFPSAPSANFDPAQKAAGNAAAVARYGNSPPMQFSPPQAGPPGGMAGPGQARPVPPGGGLAAEGFKPRPPMGQMPPAGQPGGGMAAGGFGAPRPPSPGPAMQPARPQASPFGQQTKAASMLGQFPR